MAERCGLFIIIALGESILVTGATFAEPALERRRRSPPSWSRSSAASRCGGSISTSAPSAASRQIASSDDPGRIARSGYTYIHILIVAGIIVAAVGDELVLPHPGGHDGHTDVTRRRRSRRPGALPGRQRAVQTPVGAELAAVASGRARPAGGAGAGGDDHHAAGPVGRTTAVLIMVAAWEWLSIGGRGTADAPSH